MGMERDTAPFDMPARFANLAGVLQDLGERFSLFDPYANAAPFGSALATDGAFDTGWCRWESEPGTVRFSGKLSNGAFVTALQTRGTWVSEAELPTDRLRAAQLLWVASLPSQIDFTEAGVRTASRLVARLGLPHTCSRESAFSRCSCLPCRADLARAGCNRQVQIAA